MAELARVRREDSGTRDPRRPAAPRPRATPPGPLQLLQAIRNNPLEAWSHDAYERPYIVNQRFGRFFLMLSDPEGIKRVLLDNVQNYRKGEPQQRRLRPALGQGLLTAEGDHWRAQRRAAAPMFQHKKLLSFAPAMVEASERKLREWDALLSGSEIDLAEEMMELTYAIITQTAFSNDVASSAQEIGEAISLYFETIGRPSIIDFLGLPAWIPTLDKLRARPAIAFFRSEVERVTRARMAKRDSGDAPNDLLTLLLDARDPETGQGFTIEEIQDNVITFIGAGHETTANAMAWTFYLLSEFPWAEEIVVAELSRVLGGRRPAADDVPQLPYTRQVIEEAMRLYPPAPFVGREAIAADRVSGIDVPAGANVLISPWVLHRHKALWDEPDLFDPDRFAPGRRDAIHRFAYMPFGAGQRICIGMAFAMQEAVLILATILQRYRLRLVPGAEVVPHARITLRPKDGLPMRLERRT